MCVRTIGSPGTVKARKAHECEAGVWIRESLEYIRIEETLEFSEWRAIAKLKANNWNIQPGQEYSAVTIEFEGEISTFRCLPEINAICNKYEIYQDVC